MPKVVGSVLAKVSIANDFSFYFLGEEKKSSVCVGAAWEGELTKRVIGTNNVRNSVALPCTAESVWIGRCNERPKCGSTPQKKTPISVLVRGGEEHSADVLSRGLGGFCGYYS